MLSGGMATRWEWDDVLTLDGGPVWANDWTSTTEAGRGCELALRFGGWESIGECRKGWKEKSFGVHLIMMACMQ